LRHAFKNALLWQGILLCIFRRQSTKFPLSLLALVLQVISPVTDLPETLLWLVLRIPARHWYKGITAVQRFCQRSDAGLRYGA
jgi:hypothetical protein